VLRDLKTGAKRTGAAPPVVSRPLAYLARGAFFRPHTPSGGPNSPLQPSKACHFLGGELRGTPTEGAWRRPARRLWRCTPPAPRPPVHPHPHPPGPLRKKMCSRSGCLDAKTRVLVVGVLVSTTYNNLTADALPTRNSPSALPPARRWACWVGQKSPDKLLPGHLGTRQSRAQQALRTKEGAPRSLLLADL
jgi:hypothetical protein